MPSVPVTKITYQLLLFPCGEWISKSAQLSEEHSIFIKCSSGLHRFIGTDRPVSYGQRVTALIGQHFSIFRYFLKGELR